MLMKEEKLTKKNNKKGKKKIIIIITIILLLIIIIGGVYFLLFNKKNETKTIQVESNKVESPYAISGNSLEDFDLYFLQLENVKRNKVYSPLSIKYALEMLEEGANGETKEQISNIIGKYKAKKYENSENMSFANAMFIKDSYKESVKDKYLNTLLNKYNAEIMYDSFETPDKINSWISDKTFKLINNLIDDVSKENFVLVNALAIDMEWINKIQRESGIYDVKFKHENFSKSVYPLSLVEYHQLDFKDYTKKAKSAEIGAVANKYDIVNELGEDKIRETVGAAYEKWLANDAAQESCNPGEDPDVNTYLDQYIKELNTGYKEISSSTDFYFYDNDDVKAFAKDLKTYNGLTLQYVGIMPKKENLDEYVKNTNSKKLNKIIENLKSIELQNFEDGMITEIEGYIPMFNMDYKLNLKSDLNKLGVTNVFDSNKADLSKLTSEKAYIDDVSHQANIEFSNDGIKASAATTIGGAGAGGCGFEYSYEVPVKKINLTFDNPYLFFVRDKSTGEVWFTGTVYEPVEWEASPSY